ncbi:MAG: hypothetical protein M0010_18045 [Actinomycetota bacterium]|nr:hypothetical protein [Actinomycetota bacterium]
MALTTGVAEQFTADTEIATAFKSHVQPKDVVAILGSSYEECRALALTLCLQVARRGLPVLVASPGTAPGALGRQLVGLAAGSLHVANGPAPIEVPGEVPTSIGERIRIVDDPYQSLATIWRCAAEQARCRTRPIFGLVVIDRFDAYESVEEDLLRLRETARLLGAPLVVLASRASRAGSVVGVADVVVVVEEGSVRPTVGGTPPVWIGRVPWGNEKTSLVAMDGPGSSALTAPFVVSALQRLGGFPDLAGRELRCDRDGALLGWRAFDLTTPVRARALLTSPYRGTPWHTPVETATCRLRRHRAPDPGCDCGIYATLDLDLALSKVRWPQSAGVVALVRGWGRVAIHEEGWRAEHVQPAVVFGTVPDDEKAELAYRYECEILSPERRRNWWISAASFDSRRSSSKTASTTSPRRRTSERVSPPCPKEREAHR